MGQTDDWKPVVDPNTGDKTFVKYRRPYVSEQTYYGRVILAGLFLAGGTVVFWPAVW